MNINVIHIIKILQSKGFEAVVAGGAVRDILMGNTPKDYDIATNALPNDIINLFPNSNLVGASFGVVIVDFNGEQFEIASYRTDSSFGDGRHPDSVKLGVTMEEDSNRRDFTINAMYYDPIKDEFYDYHHGKDDIDYKIIRFVGDPEQRIKEDYLRMLRAIRFANRYGFEIEFHSSRAIIKNMNHKIFMLGGISIERIGDELNKMFVQTPIFNRSCLIGDLTQHGFFDIVIPEFMKMWDIEQPKEYHPEIYLQTHVFNAFELLPSDAPLELIWATLLHDIGKPQCQEWSDEKQRYTFNGHDEFGADVALNILSRLKFSYNFIKTVCDLIRYHMKFQFVKDMKKSTLKRFLAKENFDLHLKLHFVDCMASNGNIENYEYCLQKIKEFGSLECVNKVTLPKPLVNGDDLIALDYPQGKIYKEILDYAMDLQLEGYERDYILKMIVKNYDYRIFERGI